MNLINKKKLSISNKKNILPIKNIIRRKSKFANVIIHDKKRRSSVIQLKHEAQVIQNEKEKETDDEYLKPNELDDILKKSIEKSKLGKLKKAIKFVDVLLALCVIGNIFFSLLENELFYKETKLFLNKYFENKINKEITRNVYKECEKRNISQEENSIREINLCIIVGILILNYLHYYISLWQMEEEGIISEKDGFFSTGLWKYCILETLILGICDPPYLNYFFTGTMENYIFAFSLGGLINIETLFKSYVILRVYTYFSKYMTDSANSICNNSEANSGVHFAFKC